METRALIAFVLSIAILVGYQLLVAQRQPESTEQAATTTGGSVGEDASGANPGGTDLAPPEPSTAPGEPAPPEVLTTLESDRVVAEVSSHGGRLKSFRLKQYRENASDHSSQFEMVRSADVLPLGLYWTRKDGSVAGDAKVV